MPTRAPAPAPSVRYVAATISKPLTEFGEYLMGLIEAGGYDSVHKFARDVGIHPVPGELDGRLGHAQRRQPAPGCPAPWRPAR